MRKVTKQERIEVMRDAIAFRKPKRVPMFANNCAWNLIDDGINFKDALHDWNLMYESCCNYVTRYSFDCYKPLGGRNPVLVTDAMDATDYIIYDDKIEAQDRYSIAENDYPEFIKDPKKYLW